MPLDEDLLAEAVGILMAPVRTSYRNVRLDYAAVLLCKGVDVGRECFAETDLFIDWYFSVAGCETDFALQVEELCLQTGA